jgi:type IV pilus assembly protein PilW
MKSPALNGQSGFTIVELMIALLLGSLITVAAVQLLSTNQRTFVLQQGLTDVQEQGRFAVDFLSRDLRMMGLRDAATDDVGIVLTDVIIGTTTFPAAADGGTVGAGNDRLTFSFIARDGDPDCEGEGAIAGQTVINTYWVNNGVLRCLGSVDPDSGGLELVSGVETFQVLYGIDTVQDQVPFAGRYVRADELNGTDEVVAVRIGLLVRAEQEGIAALGAPATQVVLDRELTGGVAPLTEQALRRLFVTTIRARNYVWENI